MNLKLLFAAALCTALLSGCSKSDTDIKNANTKEALTAPLLTSVIPSEDTVTTTPNISEITTVEDAKKAVVEIVTYSDKDDDKPVSDNGLQIVTVADSETVNPEAEATPQTKSEETKAPASESAAKSETKPAVEIVTKAEEVTTLPETHQTAKETSKLTFNSDYPFNTDDDFFFIVNKQIRLPDDYYIETDTVQGSYELEKTAAKFCRDMIAAAAEDGIDLKVLSAYRTVKYQQKLFDRNVKSRMEKYGMSYEEAYADTSVNIAPPGGSEHNAGLAVDIITKNDWDTYEGFEDTKEFAWLQEHAAEYGFIMRYMKEKEDITGYIYEPWHYRYVGVKYAADVQKSGLCLEEYFEKYVWGDESDIEVTIDEQPQS